MKTTLTSTLLGFLCLLFCSSCLTIMSADSQSFSYTSIGGDVGKINYDGTAHQLVADNVNNSNSYKSTMTAATSIYGIYQAGSVLKSWFSAGVEKKAISAATNQAKIQANTDQAAIAAETAQAEIAAETAETALVTP